MLEYHNGNVGIGTIYPQQKLDISGNINFTGNLYQGNQLYKSSQWENSNGIYYDGKVGIGTDYAIKELDVSGNINFTGNLYQGNQLYKSSQWDDASDNSIRFINGNVGIGTTHPSSKLDVSGNIICSNIHVKNSWFIQNDSLSLRNQFQLQPISKTFQVTTTSETVFDISMNGRYTATVNNVNVYYNGNKYAYSDANNYDFTLSVTFVDVSSTRFRVTLVEPAYYGDVVDITVYPQFLTDEGNKQPGYVYQLYNDFLWNMSGANISYTNGNIGIGTNTTPNRLTIDGNIQHNVGGITSIKSKYGGILYNTTGNRYIGFTINWTNSISDSKLAFTVSCKAHLVASEIEHAYRKIVILVSPVDDNPSYPGVINTLESSNFSTSLFTNLTHDVVRVSGTSASVRMKWTSGIQPYNGNVTIKVTASQLLGTITLTPIDGSL